MSRKRVFHTWSKHEQFRVLFNCFHSAVTDAATDPSILESFKDQQLFRLAAQFNKHVKPEDFEELKGMTVFEMGRNIVSGHRVEEEKRNTEE